MFMCLVSGSKVEFELFDTVLNVLQPTISSERIRSFIGVEKNFLVSSSTVIFLRLRDFLGGTNYANI